MQMRRCTSLSSHHSNEYSHCISPLAPKYRIADLSSTPHETTHPTLYLRPQPARAFPRHRPRSGTSSSPIPNSCYRRQCYCAARDTKLSMRLE